MTGEELIPTLYRGCVASEGGDKEKSSKRMGELEKLCSKPYSPENLPQTHTDLRQTYLVMHVVLSTL